MAATPVVSVAHESGVASWGTFAGDVPQTCRTFSTNGGDSMYKVCSTSGCPHLVSFGSLCDECRKAKDKRRSRGRNPYTSKAHRLARARVLARDPRCVCPGDGPDGCGRHHGLCGAPSTIADHWPLERVELVEAGLDPNDPTRMRGLCKRCHDSKTARTKPSGFNGRSLR